MKANLENDFGLFLNEMKNKSFLIVGGSGYFGKAFFEILNQIREESGVPFDLYSLSRSGVNTVGVNNILCDISKPFTLEQDFDYIVHAASPVSPAQQLSNEEILSIIVNGTFNLFTAVKDISCRSILNFSSGSVYGDRDYNAPFPKEQDVFLPPFIDGKNSYRTGKRISEMMTPFFFKKTSTKFNIVRGFAFSGRHLPLNSNFAIGNFVRDAIEMKEIRVAGNPDTLRSYMDSEDLVYWILKILLGKDSDQIYNIGSDCPIKIKDLAELIAKINGHTAVNFINKGKQMGSLSKYVPDISKGRRELSLSLKISLEKSIERMFQQHRH